MRESGRGISHSREQTKQIEHFDTLGFTKRLESFGLTSIENDRRGEDYRTRARVVAGVYDMVVSLPEINPFDQRFMYGNNDRDMRDRPIRLETKTTRFLTLLDQFEKHNRGKGSLGEQMEALNDVIQEAIESNFSDERISSSEDILKRKASACAGKTLISGLILKESNPNLVVQKVVGASAQTEGRLSHDIGHEWLRVADPASDEVVLYDSYYNHLVPYNLKSPRAFDGDPFANYDVSAIHVAQLDRMAGFEGANSEDIKFVKYPGKESSSMRVATGRAHGVQIMGEIGSLVQLAGGTLEFINGAIEVSFNPKKRATSSRDLYSMISFQRVK
ncbi:hypothetical protein ACFLZY_02145 [Patescibacteria group bacterium]